MKVTDWNIFVSSKSLTLAVHGLEGTKQYIYDTLDRLGIRTGAESIGRVDYALDFLLPSSFTLDYNAFVSHWHTQHKQHHDLQTVGTSGHLTSVTLGKMPGRQIIFYDKRADTISKHKDEWWDIWNIACAAQNMPLLQKEDRKCPRVWRIELRAGKKHLKDPWGISRWPDLDDKLQLVFLDNIARNRYCIPTQDSNRSRWPDHPLWEQVREAVKAGLPSPPSGLSLDRAKEIKRKHFQETMERQVAGIIPSYAVALGMADAPANMIINAAGRLIRDTAASKPERWQKMMKRAKDKRIFTSATPER